MVIDRVLTVLALASMLIVLPEFHEKAEGASIIIRGGGEGGDRHRGHRGHRGRHYRHHRYRGSGFHWYFTPRTRHRYYRDNYYQSRYELIARSHVARIDPERGGQVVELRNGMVFSVPNSGEEVDVGDPVRVYVNDYLRSGSHYRLRIENSYYDVYRLDRRRH